MLSWCERHEVGYIVGLAKNARINDQAARGMAFAAAAYERTGEKQRVFADLMLRRPELERRERRVIARLEHGPKGANPRYVITNLEGEAKALYERLYCARGEMENRIKEQQLALFADRTSCHKWWPNQFRLILSSLAYTLIATIRRLGLRGTKMARAQADTIRLKLLKIGAVVIRNTRRVRLHLSSACPYQDLVQLSRQPGSSRDNRPLRSYPTQTHKRCRRLPARAPLAQNRPKQAKTGNGTDNHQPESPASLKSANRKTRDPAFGVQKPYFRTLRDESGLAHSGPGRRSRGPFSRRD